MKKKLKELKWKIDSLTVFSHIKNDDVIRRLQMPCLTLWTSMFPTKKPTMPLVFTAILSLALYENTADLTDYIHTLLLQDDNFYVKETAAGRSVPETIRQSALAGSCFS